MKLRAEIRNNTFQSSLTSDYALKSPEGLPAGYRAPEIPIGGGCYRTVNQYIVYFCKPACEPCGLVSSYNTAPNSKPTNNDEETFIFHLDSLVPAGGGDRLHRG